MTNCLIREPVVAGSFYPEDPEDLAEYVDELYRNAEPPSVDGRVRAIIVPHAGYTYSGHIAASGFALLPEDARRFFILASNHSRTTPPFKFALPPEEKFATPLGEVDVDPVVTKLLESHLFSVVPEAHSSHIIEVQLPFLQRRFHDFEITPVVTGVLFGKDLIDAAELLWQCMDGRDVLVVSSDLSHYHKYDEAVVRDRRCMEAIEQMDEAATARAEACGLPAALMLLHIAKARGWVCQRVEYANSGDVSADRSRVVGYGALVFYERRLVH